MKIRALAAALLSLTAVASALATAPSPYAGQHQRVIKSLSADEQRGWLEGQGMGLARAAELNSHPGPMHALELAEPLALPAYERMLKTSHTFNLLDARGVVSPTERQSFIARVRDLAKGCASAWAEGQS